MPLLRTLTRRLFGGGRALKIVVRVPEGTPPGEPVYLSGACSELGEWQAAGRKLRQTDRGVWETSLRVPIDQPIEFKVTRGSWEKVERHADGSDTGNHRVEPSDFGRESVLHTVERWSDVA